MKIMEGNLLLIKGVKKWMTSFPKQIYKNAFL
jgi:hypothetical protein